MYLGSWKIDDLLTFPANTHAPSTGAATDADAVPAYRVYEDETATPILTGNMALLDGTNTVGFYSEQITLSAANGFEKGKSYTVYISAAVGGVTGTMSHSFQIEAEVDANSVSNIGAGVITATAIATGAIDADAIADNAIDAGAIAADAITAAKIADGAIDAATFAAGAITATVIATGAIDADAIADNAIDAGAIAADAITAAKIADNAIADQPVASVTGAVGSVTAGVTLAASAVQAIWDALTAALTTVGSIGKLLVDNIDAAITSRLAPTVAGRTLDVSTGGEAGLDWANIGSPTTAQNLSGTNIDPDQVVASVTGAVGSVTGNVGGNVVGSVGSVAGDIGGLAAGAVTDVQDAVWDAPLANHQDVGSTGEALGNASSAGDPWATALPGAYGAGTAGKIVGDNLNATVGSRATQASVDTIDGLVDAIKAKTDQLVFTLANKVDASIQAAGDFAQAAADKVWSTAARTLTAFGFSVTVGTNNDKTGYALTAAERNAGADALLARNIGGGSSTGRIVTDALRLLRNKRSVAGGVLTVTQEDDATPAWTAAVSTAASDPIDSIDPS